MTDDFEVHPVGTAAMLLDPSAEPMTRTETIRRRFEAMRMRWPERALIFMQQEVLILALLKMQPHINRRLNSDD